MKKFVISIRIVFLIDVYRNNCNSFRNRPKYSYQIKNVTLHSSLSPSFSIIHTHTQTNIYLYEYI